MNLKIEITKFGWFGHWAKIYIDGNFINGGGGMTKKRAILSAFRSWGEDVIEDMEPVQVFEVKE